MFGNPARIITGKRIVLTANEFEVYCSTKGIKHVLITNGVARGNGQIERTHRTVISVLTKLNLDNSGHWYKYVGWGQRALNNTVQRSIDATPFKIMIGIKVRQKEEVQLTELLEKKVIEQFNRNRIDFRNDSKKQSLKVQEENRESYNLRRKKPNASG